MWLWQLTLASEVFRASRSFYLFSTTIILTSSCHVVLLLAGGRSRIHHPIVILASQLERVALAVHPGIILLPDCHFTQKGDDLQTVQNISSDLVIILPGRMMDALSSWSSCTG